jgi:hypothetical protein
MRASSCTAMFFGYVTSPSRDLSGHELSKSGRPSRQVALARIFRAGEGLAPRRGVGGSVTSFLCSG